MKKAFWAISLLVTLLNLIGGAIGFFGATGAPQQAAAAAGSLMFIVGFYCLARAVEGLNAKD